MPRAAPRNGAIRLRECGAVISACAASRLAAGGKWAGPGAVQDGRIGPQTRKGRLPCRKEGALIRGRRMGGGGGCGQKLCRVIHATGGAAVDSRAAKGRARSWVMRSLPVLPREPGSAAKGCAVFSAAPRPGTHAPGRTHAVLAPPGQARQGLQPGPLRPGPMAFLARRTSPGTAASPAPGPMAAQAPRFPAPLAAPAAGR